MNKIFITLCRSDLAYYVLPNYIDYPNAYFFMFCERKQGFFGANRHLLDRYMPLKKRFVVVSNTDAGSIKRCLGGIMGSEKAQTMVKGFCEDAYTKGCATKL
ncbi:MAG: hypothetical protein FWE34_05115 [Defluviitaleaceae bacterium]|nr:hypothetical protein [Defluviitaleaceae bacterium]